MGAVAERVTMDNRLFLDQLPVGFQPLDYRFVGILDKQALIQRYFFGELAVLVDRTHYRNAGSFEHLIVILTESGCGMNDTAAVLDGHIIAKHRDEGSLLLQMGEEREQRFITQAAQFTAFVAFKDFVQGRILVIMGEPRLSENVAFTALSVPDEHIIDIRPQSQSQV